MKVKQQLKVDTEQRPWTLDWHPQGKILASAGSSKSFTIWSYSQTTLQKISTIPTQHTKTIRSIKFSHKGDKIALASFDSTISVWVFNNEIKDYQMISTLQGHQNQVKCISWSNNDKKIASCSRDKNIWVWDFDQISYDYVCDAVLEGHTQDVKFVDWFAQEQNKLVSASYDNTIRIWQGQDDDYVCRQVLEGHKSIVWNVQVFGNRMLSVGEDCLIIQWIRSQQQDKYQIEKVYEGAHILPIYTATIYKNKYLVTGSADNSIAISKIYNCYENQKQQKQEKEQLMQKQKENNKIQRVWHQSDVNCVKINNVISGIFASCSDDESIKIFRICQEQKEELN